MKPERNQEMTDAQSERRISIQLDPSPQFHYVSGLTVYAERFSDGKLVGSYWSANGCVDGAEEFPGFGIDVPCHAFSMNLDGQSLDWGWRFVSADRGERAGSATSSIGLAHETRPVSVRVCTEVDGTGFLSRWLEITSTGTGPSALSSVDVFSGVLLSGAALRGGDFQTTPFRIGRFTGNNWGQEGRFAWEPLANGLVTGLQAAGPYGTSGFHCPYFMLASEKSAGLFSFYLGWSGLWKAEVLCDTTLRRMLHVRLGPDAPAPMRILAPGETLVTPRVHIGYRHGDLDGCVQAAHDHIRRSVIPASAHARSPLVTHNSAGSQGLDRLDEPSTLRDIELAHELGAEVYMIDAGWFGKGPADRRAKAPYPRWMGDWVPGEWYPNGFDPIVASLRSKGMRFGLWIEPEGIGLHSEVYRRHPDWIVKREGRPLPHLAERLNIDYTSPEVREWIESELVRIIADYQVDVIRFDGAPMSAYIGERIENGYVENILWRHYEFLYGLMERLASRFPGLIIENCCGGGGRLDLGILSRSHRTQITDEGRPPRSVQILNGITLMLPPEYCMVFPFLPDIRLETADLDFSFRLLLFAGFYNLGWTSRPDDRHPGYRDRAKRYISLYKSRVAPMLPGCRVFHHTPVVRIDGEDRTPYCIWEYVSADARAALVGIFKLTDAPEPCRFVPRGLNVRATYRVRFDNEAAETEMSGVALRQQGITVSLPAALTSELLLFERI
jgi:alpha-galactosidase